MKACDRHGRSEGSLKVGRFEVSVYDLEDPDEHGRPIKKFEQEFCPACFEAMLAWSKTNPESLFLVEGEAEPAKKAAKGAK